MSRVCTSVRAGLAILSLLAGGCGQDPFGAPARPPSTPGSTGEEPQAAPAIFMVIPSAPTAAIEVWSVLAQQEANSRNAIYRLMSPAPGQASSSQPEVVRKAVADGATALIVVAGDSTELAQALVEAEAKNVPVVLLGGTIPAPAGSKPFTYVDHDPFAGWAKKIVATTIEDVKKAGRPLEGTVILLSDRAADRTSAGRLAALKAAVGAASLHSAEEVSFDGSTPGMAKVAVLDAIKSHPDIIMVFTDEGVGLLGASQARISLGGEPAFFVGGFSGYRTGLNDILLEKESCFVEGRVEDLARLAVSTALKKLKGEAVQDRVELSSIFHRGSGEIASPVDKGSNVTAQDVRKMVDDVMSRKFIPAQPTPRP